MKKLINKLTIILAIVSFIIFTTPRYSEARMMITDWYIKDMQSEITVNKDSSLLITETIIADCGNLPDKHGIFRILPTTYKMGSKTIKTPIELISITDKNGNNLNFSTINNNSYHTVTWRIGDPDKAVTGENTYVIKYLVKNTIRFNNANFDEFYWNLNGNYWDIEIDKFTADIYFPEEITGDNSEIYLYSGRSSNSENTYAKYKWTDNNILTVESTKTLPIKTGITASLTFPKNIITAYEMSFWEQYGDYSSLLLPIFVFIISFMIWKKYGKDPIINPTIAPEFEIPENFSPMEMGMIYSDAIMKKEYVSASIINLAIKKIIKIEEIEAKGLFTPKDYKLTLLSNNFSKLSLIEIQLVNKLFGEKSDILISEQKNKFYKKVEELRKQIKDDLAKKNLLYKYSRTTQGAFVTLGIFLTFFLGGIGEKSSNYFLGSMVVSIIVIFVFSFFMTKRTIEGAEMKRRIEGFKLYLHTAERYRQQFNEKENIFDEFLPYAIMFGMTKEWIKKMKIMYGEEKFNSYVPYWYMGANLSSFDANSFASSIESISSDIASSLGASPSGSGGAGASGGGGGGGGGGGW